MPITARKYNPEINTTPPWHDLQPLMEHFGPVTMAQPARLPKIAPQPAKTKKTKPKSANLKISKAKPKHVTHYRPFRPARAALFMWGILGSLLVGLLALRGTTLRYSRMDADVTQKIRLTNEAIDNANKNIAAIQVSPELAQWAMTHGWHVATQADIDEVPAYSQQVGE